MDDQDQKDWTLFLKHTSDPNNIHQTKENPMCPLLFYELSTVNGFNDINGHTYEEYIEIWKKIKMK